MLNSETEADRYESPRISDYGDLVEITQACFGTGGEDGGSKANGNPFVNSAPFFGDSTDFCQIPS